jgi:adenosylmethionine-8-amino-7-oxononanoate aminotransferase
MLKSDLITRDRSVIWHPFTQSALQQSPLAISEAHGAWLHLETGERLLDGISSWWCNLHGHGHPALVAAATEQFQKLDHVLFAGCTHEPAVSLAEQLLAILPQGLSKIFYSDNGSTAVEVALKLAIQFWHNRGESKRTIAALKGSYHGDTFGAMAAGARSLFSKPFDPLLFDVKHFSTCAEDDELSSFETLCRSGSVAAFIFEPHVQGAGGMNVYDLVNLERYLAICREHDVLCIADEVMTGFGRTGPLFASSGLQHAPDLICLSKGLTSGSIPLAVTACSERVFEEFVSSDYSRTFFHGHTYTGNPIACAVAIASLSLTLSDECTAARARIEAAHKDCIATLTELPCVENARVAGTILAFDYRDPHAAGYLSNVKAKAMDFFQKRGVLLRPLGNVIYTMPPYCVQTEDLALLHEALVDFATCDY